MYENGSRHVTLHTTVILIHFLNLVLFFWAIDSFLWWSQICQYGFGCWWINDSDRNLLCEFNEKEVVLGLHWILTIIGNCECFGDDIACNRNRGRVCQSLPLTKTVSRIYWNKTNFGSHYKGVVIDAGTPDICIQFFEDLSSLTEFKLLTDSFRFSFLCQS